jgi:hypothetical protein
VVYGARLEVAYVLKGASRIQIPPSPLLQAEPTLVVAAPALGSTKLSPAEISRLGARTEAAGFTAVTRYLVDRASSADAAMLAARTEAQGYRALVRYQMQRAVTAGTIETSSSAFAWADALAGAGITAGVFMFGTAAALMVRERRVSARIRP